ncbi:sugar phosphate nucleotidyltransferase [Paenibacillus roseipurpureus]|uniref:Sugar phosphate nucleotidyltransferase n=1 Tax=Paenibacillus roseopurpureus TaxID=2918901 RepID=A0AA96RJ50_9BACL|nr:sugar phosphate nucleotidyltransferase [Paenibacillus sp. MBLB1832]WNR43505.1 sugar phosphate nucleotidyltransferase [Paenibacillus sp. MBLB1832]
MKLVLLSGGSGKRLWPLSNDSRSKQFLKVLENEDGEMESMVQRVWRQIRNVELSDSTYVATGKAQLDMIYSQLGTDAPIIVEPERRDTFPAIALAATYLYSIVGVSLHEVVTVLPVDPYVENRFFNKVKELEHIVVSSGADIGLIGVKPTYPSAKYGYIVPEQETNSDSYRKVSHFTEKPHEDQARLLIERDALWNCGVFAFKLDYLINLLIEKGIPIQYEELVKQYESLVKISFDYEVVEKANHVVVAPYDGYWKDLGTWNTLTEEVSSHIMGNGMICADSRNTHIVNELDLPVTVIGLSNIVVATSPDGILVADKASSPRIKDMMRDVDTRPMYEERRWGWYKVLDYSKLGENQHVLTKRICIGAGKNSSYQLHHKRSETWTFIAGEGELVLNEKLIPVKAGDVIQIPMRSRHAIRGITDLEFIEVQTGSELIEEDIIRLYMSWEEILAFSS